MDQPKNPKSFLEMNLQEAEAYLKAQSSLPDLKKEARLARRRALYRIRSNNKLLKRIQESK